MSVAGPEAETVAVAPSSAWSTNWLTLAFASVLAGDLVLRTVLGGYPLNTPGYDGGVYYGTAALLLRGVTPYHGYVFLQPPGSTLLLTPFAALGSVTSSSVGLLAAHYFVVAVAAANLVLLGMLLRHRSPWAIAVGLAVAAFYGDAVVANSSVLLEPLVALSVLIALVSVTRRERLTSSPGAWLWAGVALGAGTSIKIWGALVFVVLLVPALRRGRRVATPYVLGFVAVLGAVCLPFFALAPGSFWRQVVTDQATRASSGGAGLFARVANLLDVYQLSGRHSFGVATDLAAVVGMLVVVLAVVVLARVARATPDQRRAASGLSVLDVVVLISLAVVVLAFLGAHQYYAHYGGFVAPLVGVVLSTAAVIALATWRRTTVVVVVVVVVVLCAGAFIRVSPRQSTTVLTSALARAIPPSDCVASWNPAAAILADRFSAGQHGCPVILDVYGTELAEDHGYGESPADQTSARVQDQLLAWLRAADAVILSQSPAATHDLGPAVTRYLVDDFPQARRIHGWYVFLRSP